MKECSQKTRKKIRKCFGPWVLVARKAEIQHKMLSDPLPKTTWCSNICRKHAETNLHISPLSQLVRTTTAFALPEQDMPSVMGMLFSQASSSLKHTMQWVTQFSIFNRSLYSTCWHCCGSTLAASQCAAGSASHGL